MVFAGFITGLLLLGVYFLPTIIALCRKAHYMTATILINILFGWTFIGWVVALILSLINRVEPQVTINVVQDKIAKTTTKKKTTKKKK